MLRILWHSNAVWARSGYGGQSKINGEAIAQLGHTVHYSANWGLQGSIVDLDANTKVYPSLRAESGDDLLLPSHAEAMKADIVITLYDAWTFDPVITKQFCWIPWLPIDMDRISKQHYQALAPAYRVIAFTRYGQKKLKEVGIESSYVPHSLDTRIWRPLDKAEAREGLGFPPDKFIVLVTAMNKGYPARKAFPEILWAWKAFAEGKKDKVLLHFHSNDGPAIGGPSIRGMASELGITPETLSIADQYSYFLGYKTSYMVGLTNAADVLLLPSYGEGFGIPLIEAQSVGVPVITSDFGAMKELCNAGWLVEGQPFLNVLAGFYQVPFIDSIVAALEESYKCRGDTSLSEQAIESMKQYDIRYVTQEHWTPVLDEIEESLSTGGELNLFEGLE